MAITNIANRPRIINKNTPIGTIEIESPYSNCFSISPLTSTSLLSQQPSDNDEDVAMSIQVKNTIDEMASHLNQQQKQLLLPILYQHNSLFDTSEPKIAKTHIYHTIPTNVNSNPVNSKPYRVSSEKQKIIDNQIDSMYTSGLIRPSQSAWSSPVVLVKKKDGTYRFCVDYRRLNQITMKDSYPLPHMEETINQLGGSSYFSKMDLKSGYFQLPIDEKDKPKTAFITSRGLWEFNVLPQGLKNAPPSFQRVLNNLLATGRWQFCLIYLDDIIIFSKSFPDHCTHLNNVLSVLNQANFQLNPPKCAFAQSEIDYLGHTINAKGFKPLNTNINAIVQVPNPRAAKQKKFPFILSTDASQFGIAGALKQHTPDGLEPIVYISRTLNSSERNYSTFERECLGVIWSVTKLRDYLADESFIIETDQQLARNIHLNRSSTNRRVNNWKLQLHDYDIIEIKHKPGTRNCDADYMSRHPLINIEEANDELEGICVAIMTRSKTKQQTTTAEDIPTTTSSNTSSTSFYSKQLSPLDPSRLKHEQHSDPDIQFIVRKLNNKPNMNYLIKNEILNIQLRNGKYVPIIPNSLRNEILHSFHDHPTAGHFGRDKTWNRLKDRCSWPTIRQDVIRYIQSCTTCTHYNIRRHKPPGHMQLIEPPGEAFDLVQMDFAGPLPQSINGIDIKAVPNDSTQTAAEFLIDITLEFGPPHQLQTDRGSHFTSAIFEAVANRLGCVHTVSTPYHPQSQGVIERFNATFKQQLSKYTNEHYDDWDVYLNTIVSFYNSSIHQITQFPPFQIFHKRKPISIFDPIKKQVTIPRVNDYWNHFLRFEKVYMDQVKKNIRQQQQYSKRRYDRHRPNIQFKIDQKVFIIKPGMHPAFRELYEGPYTIIKQLGPQTFDVLDVHDNMKRVHSSQMKPFLERE
ncbi:unnamed protein product [Rotaria magnacalcarata]|uniref:Reverse transcriptase n=1 Tax=Rotaria magnacalcarata TaxID=392030 RepID=A0A815ZIG5_9BILA|nr:unnamed protein product [Rotaria magnacalcarata]